MIEMTSTPNGVVLPVQGQPGARRNAIAGVHAGRLKVAVTQVAEKGKATEAIRELLADSLGISLSRVTLIQGESQPKKLFLLQGISLDAAKQWLEKALKSPR